MIIHSRSAIWDLDLGASIPCGNPGVHPIRGVIEHPDAVAWRGFARHREVKPLAPTRVSLQAPHSSLASDLTNPSLYPSPRRHIPRPEDAP
ncbi:hypothetical protein B0H13DRAFT_2351120 [Mycena leptocephala]|nr:hypothetical protein B0H13DRAFT_2351120 [Mycena leptocephala]